MRSASVSITGLARPPGLGWAEPCAPRDALHEHVAEHYRRRAGVAPVFDRLPQELLAVFNWQLRRQFGHLVSANEPCERHEDRLRMMPGGLRVHLLALCHAPHGLAHVEVLRLLAVGEQPHAQLHRKVLAELAGLGAGDPLAERFKCRPRCTLRPGPGYARQLLDGRDEALVAPLVAVLVDQLCHRARVSCHHQLS
jgi:hypothetical protein